ncbi:MAG TPA: hypothetical protein VML94_07880 [Thermoplasmata archaeon]|nr:hypothetical protein [Thermoplasmata archaeon]
MSEGDSSQGLEFRVILIIGSFDPETKQVLTNLKAELAAGLMSESWVALVLLVDDVDLYKVDAPGSTETYSIISERVVGGVSAYLSRNGRLIEAHDARFTTGTADDYIAEFAKTRLGGTTLKLPIFEKVAELANIMSAAFLVRHIELTRGGEYIELAFLIGSDRSSAAHIWFFKHEGVELSQMAWEILDKFGVQVRPYRREPDLYVEAIRVARYQTAHR